MAARYTSPTARHRRPGSYLHHGRAMRERLPKVGQVFAAGEIDYHMFQTLVYRTDLITDPQVLARVDAELALRVRERGRR
ncbi:DUF222 domain-containing protein [Mycobacterium tuberculosis]|uniref:DUF222 domain-containing protein n=1 Tax=Mycobacterium tuberculosis TaxID=1773 RepID=UPI0032B4CF76